jgi:hypothetical protein
MGRARLAGWAILPRQCGQWPGTRTTDACATALKRAVAIDRWADAALSVIHP